MKASQLIKNLQELIEKYGDLDLIYAKDDEGNGYYSIWNIPTPCEYYDECDIVFNNEDRESFEPNAFCVN